MKKRVAIVAIGIILLCAVWAGLNIPIGSYTTAGGCLVGDEPIKLHLIKGDSLEAIRNSPEEIKNIQYFSSHNGPLDECGPARSYELYIF